MVTAAQRVPAAPAEIGNTATGPAHRQAIDAPVLRAMDRVPPFAVQATRPICRWPLYPHYRPGRVGSQLSLQRAVNW